MIELTPGQDVALVDANGQPLQRITIGLGWDKDPTAGFIASGRAEIDLDASAFQFSGGRLFDLAFFNNLATRDGSVVHQGDNQSGSGDEDDEQIVVDLTRVHGPVDTIVFLVSSYQGHPLQWIAGCYCRVEDADGAELARLTLTLGVPETGVVMATLVRDRAPGSTGWRMLGVGRGIAATNPATAVEALAPFA